MLKKFIQLFTSRNKAIKKQRLIEDIQHETKLQESIEKAKSSRYIFLNSTQITELIQRSTMRFIKADLEDIKKANRVAKNIRVLLNAQDLIEERERLELAQERIFEFPMRKAA